MTCMCQFEFLFIAFLFFLIYLCFTSFIGFYWSYSCISKYGICLCTLCAFLLFLFLCSWKIHSHSISSTKPRNVARSRIDTLCSHQFQFHLKVFFLSRHVVCRIVVSLSTIAVIRSKRITQRNTRQSKNNNNTHKIYSNINFSEWQFVNFQ